MIPRAPGDGPRDLSRPLEHLSLLADDRHADLWATLEKAYVGFDDDIEFNEAVSGGRN